MTQGHGAFDEQQRDIQVRNSSGAKNTSFQSRLQSAQDEVQSDQTRKAEKTKQLGRQNP
jgi:hypothetical protein